MIVEVTSGLRRMEEHEVDAAVASLFSEARREMQMPFVPNMMKVLASSPAGLRMYWGVFKSFLSNLTLPRALASMIFYAVAERRNCRYCSAVNELVCRSVGVDESTLQGLVSDLVAVSPARVRAVVSFAIKAAEDPQGLAADDYDAVRRQGVSDEELIEIVLVASLANFTDTLADALKVDVDAPVAAALGRPA